METRRRPQWSLAHLFALVGVAAVFAWIGTLIGGQLLAVLLALVVPPVLIEWMPLRWRLVSAIVSFAVLLVCCGLSLSLPRGWPGAAVFFSSLLTTVWSTAGTLAGLRAARDAAAFERIIAKHTRTARDKADQPDESN